MFLRHNLYKAIDYTAYDGNIFMKINHYGGKLFILPLVYLRMMKKKN